jgi:large subunit ribosomal protein L15
MDLHTLKPSAGSKKNRKRVGRGPGSGMGETAAKGHKGAKARTGFKHKWGYEGGQMPLHRRLPKFGFNNPFRQEFQIVNLKDLARVESAEISGESLYVSGLVSRADRPIKILGNGTVEKALTVKAQAFSKSAKDKIEKAGGKTEVVKC